MESKHLFGWCKNQDTHCPKDKLNITGIQTVHERPEEQKTDMRRTNNQSDKGEGDRQD